MAFYRKNIGAAQQIIRLAAGIATAAASIALFTAPLSWIGAASGAIFAVTGLVGYCPMCAMANIGGGRPTDS